MKGTPLRRRRRGGHLSGQNGPFRFSEWIHGGYGGKKRLGVGMNRGAADRLRPSQLNDLPQIHDGDPVAHVADHPQVMGDEEIGQVKLPLQALQQIEDLSPYGNIQGRNRLIRDHKPWLQNQRPGDSDPLPLSAAEFMRVAGQLLLIQADNGCDLPELFFDLLPSTRMMVDMQGLFDDAARRLPRIEGGIGILKDHLNLPAERLQCAPLPRENILVIEPNLPRRRRFQSQDHARKG